MPPEGFGWKRIVRRIAEKTKENSLDLIKRGRCDEQRPIVTEITVPVNLDKVTDVP
jgi:hypothetical protein